MPLFRKGLGPYALPLAMSSVKLGERLLYVGSGSPRLFAATASKAGLTGRACAVVNGTAEAEAVQRAAAREGVLVEIAAAAAGTFPYDAASFDVVVIDSTDGAFGAASTTGRTGQLAEIFRVMRPGARLLVVEGVAGGVGAIFKTRPADTAYRSSGGAIAALSAAGFRPVRMLAERERLRFTEGIKPGQTAHT
jgi:SAM-dependent methyltransferase